MFVRPLVLLISNNFSCFSCSLVCRSLHQILATKEQNGPSEVKEFLPMRSNALGAFERNCCRTQGLDSNASPVNPHLMRLP
jgi:hypothetical protein